MNSRQPSFDWRVLPLTCRAAVQTWQCDFMGHMNVQFYTARFDDATWSLASTLGLHRDYLMEHGVAMASVQQNVTYLRELLAGEVISIYSGVHEIKERTVRFEHVLVHELSGQVSARCEVTAVHMQATERRAIAIPKFVREKAQAVLIPQ